MTRPIQRRRLAISERLRCLWCGRTVVQVAGFGRVGLYDPPGPDRPRRPHRCPAEIATFESTPESGPSESSRTGTAGGTYDPSPHEEP